MSDKADRATPKSLAQRVRESEARKRKGGQKEIRLWIPDEPECIKQVRDMAAKLCAERTKPENAQ